MEELCSTEVGCRKKAWQTRGVLPSFVGFQLTSFFSGSSEGREIQDLLQNSPGTRRGIG